MFWCVTKKHRYYPIFGGIFLIIMMLVMHISMNPPWTISHDHKMLNLTKSNFSKPIRKRGPPYLTYIVSAISKRLNSTMKNLHEKMPGFFNIHHRKSVSFNDSRILRSGDMKVSSLLLTYVDLWSYFGSRPESEFADNDWMFLFEDDVDIVPMSVIESFQPKLSPKWNHSSPNHCLEGRNVTNACLDISILNACRGRDCGFSSFFKLCCETGLFSRSNCCRIF